MKAWATALVRAAASRGAVTAPRVIPSIARYATASTPPKASETDVGNTVLKDPVQDTQNALRLLRTQPNHYVMASITGRTLILSEADIVTLPRLRNVEVGDVLELDRIHEVGSRNYTLRAQDPALGRRKAQGGRFPLVLFQEHGEDNKVRANAVRVATNSTDMAQASPDKVLPWSSSWAAQLIPTGLAHVGAALPSEVVRVRCVVIEHTKGPMERIEKFKRRKGYHKTVTHKQPYTRLRVDAISLGSA